MPRLVSHATQATSVLRARHSSWRPLASLARLPTCLTPVASPSALTVSLGSAVRVADALLCVAAQAATHARSKAKCAQRAHRESGSLTRTRRRVLSARLVRTACSAPLLLCRVLTALTRTGRTWARQTAARSVLVAPSALSALHPPRSVPLARKHRPLAALDARRAMTGGSSQIQEPPAAYSAVQAAFAQQARASSCQQIARLARLPTCLRLMASPTALPVHLASRVLAARRSRPRAALATLQARTVALSAPRARLARTSLHATRRAARLVSTARSVLRARRRRSRALPAPTRTPRISRRQPSASSARRAPAARPAALLPRRAHPAASRRPSAAPSAAFVPVGPTEQRQMAPRATRARREDTTAHVARRRRCRAPQARVVQTHSR